MRRADDLAASRAARREREVAQQRQHLARHVHRGSSNPLSQGQAVATSGRVTAPPEIFDRATRRRQRDRAAASFGEHDFVRAVMLDGIEERVRSERAEAGVPGNADERAETEQIEGEDQAPE